VNAEVGIQVCVLKTFGDAFDYLAPQPLPAIGARVLVPFRRQERVGIVVALESALPHDKLKTIIKILDNEPVLMPAILTLCQWISRYYHAPLSEVIHRALPKKIRLGESLEQLLQPYYTLAQPLAQAQANLKPQATKQHALLNLLATHASLSHKEVRGYGFSKAQLDQLAAQGAITRYLKPPECPISNAQVPAHVLNDEQNSAVHHILPYLHRFQCFLLEGITGSGKTEVYFTVIKHLLAQQKQVLILVPEIGLTPQLCRRFEQQFSTPLVVIHSRLNDHERLSAWQHAKTGNARLVIGTRAAIFTPMPDLGLIIIDEEHDSSFKQLDGVRYSARDSALMRAKALDIPVILGSATPSLESLHNALSGRFGHIKLTKKAQTGAKVRYIVSDIRQQKLQEGLAASTIATIKKHLQAKNQVLVFINRRGFAPILMCHQCGWLAHCLHCDSHLTLHTTTAKLLCHHCNMHQTRPTQCQQCTSHELIAVGLGTQRITQHLQTLFPNTSIARIDRDEVQSKEGLAAHLEAINQQTTQLIIGTQMLAKGHDFPHLTLVVVLDTDTAFYSQDFRALEQLGQILTQVAGRAGRAKAGEVIIQTHLPEQPLLQTLLKAGYHAFAQALLAARQQARLPPFAYIAVIRAQHHSESRVHKFLMTLKPYLQNFNLDLLGPAPAPLYRKARVYRLQLLLKATNRPILHQALHALCQHITLSRHQGVQWSIDVDPIDLF
tara:strand:+ start:3535 stop:5703 length:2169 start_codon:yes stop_codon:yes gene_type:complete